MIGQIRLFRQACAAAFRAFSSPVRNLRSLGKTILLTTQYLDEAEHLADRIAILHDGRIIAGGTLEELKRLLPPAKVEYIEKQPTLEEIFLAVVGKKPEEADL